MKLETLKDFGPDQAVDSCDLLLSVAAGGQATHTWTHMKTQQADGLIRQRVELLVWSFCFSVFVAYLKHISLPNVDFFLVSSREWRRNMFLCLRLPSSASL